MSFLDIIFPKTCVGCKRVGKYICADCLSQVKVTNRFDPTHEIFSIFKYEGVVRKAIIKIKYGFAFDIAGELATICVQSLPAKYISHLQNAILIPIPLYRSRHSWRGFNQSEIIGQLIAKKLKVNFHKDLLTRPIEGKNQVGLTYSERVRNMCGKFAVNTVKISSIKTPNPKFVIFDDVATTGSTLKEAIKALKKSGSFQVTGFTIAE